MTSRRTMEAYDRIADDFSRIHATMPDTLTDYGRRFLSLVGPEPQVLDVGCGTGRDMAWLEAQGARVTGIDLSRGMLAQARPHVRGDLLPGDMRHLPFPTGTFAGVWCMAALLHLPKAEAPVAVAEMRRVLRPGGVMHLSLQEGDGEAWERVPYRSDLIERFFARYAHDETCALLERPGFAILDSRTYAAGDRRWVQALATALPADARHAGDGL